MESLVYILKTFFYFYIVWIIYVVSYKNGSKKNKFGIVSIIIISCLIGYYSLICGRIPYAGDRYNYAFRFVSDTYAYFVKTESIGLYWLESFLHLFTYNPDVLFFIVAFLYSLITLLAYKYNDKSMPIMLLILGLSSYISFGFYMLKQCLAIALIALSFSAYSRNKKILFLILNILAICFHESTWIMIPFYLILKLSENRHIRNMIYILFIIFVFFFSQINSVIISVFVHFIPSIGVQLSYYLTSSGSLLTSINLMTALKGLPFYFIFLFSVYKSKLLSNKIENFNKYMMMCFLICIMTILSSYMYWMFRFAIFLYFPVFIFAGQVFKALDEKKDKTIYLVFLCLILFGLTLRLWLQYYFLYGGI